MCGVVGRAVKRGRERPLCRCFAEADGWGLGCVVVVGVLVPMPLVATLLNAERTTLA